MTQKAVLHDGRYVAVCKRSSIRDGHYAVHHLGPDEILVLNIRGEIFAIANRCSHMSKPLAGGRLMGHQFVCPFHSAHFDVRSGKALGFPASRPIKTFEVHVEHDTVFIAPADPPQPK